MMTGAAAVSSGRNEPVCCLPYFKRWTTLLAVLGAIAWAAAADATDLRTRYGQLQARWMAQAEQLADQIESKGEAEAAESIRHLMAPATAPSTGISIVITPPTAQVPAAAGRPDWQIALQRIRKQHAKDLFELAALAQRVGEISFAYDLVREVLDHDPDHGSARALLGFTRYRDQWVTPFAAGKLRGGFVWDERFGWVPKAHLERYEKGLQLWKGQWMPAEEVSKFRQNWANAWEIETDHYVVRTNVSLERGVELAAKLEKLNAIFFRLFAGFFSPRDQIAVLFEGPGRRAPGGKASDRDSRSHRKFRVYFYRTRDEYLDALRPFVKSGLDMSTGMYLTGTRIAYFYHDVQRDDANVIHEGTHQLFSETREHRHGDGSRGNHWVLEGVACYMESFRESGDRVELGSWDTPRLKRGRQRLKDFRPLDEFIRLDMKDFDGSDVVVLYAQAACFAHFLMHYEGGRYREPFVRYLEDVYLGRADHDTLGQLLEIDYATLDKQFQKHVADGSDQ